MQKFITLYKNLNSTEDELSRTTMVQGYLSELSDVEKKPAISLLLNQKKYTLLSTSSLVHLAEEYKNYPLWLLKRCNESVKDWSETISLIVMKPDLPAPQDITLHDWLDHIHSLALKKGSADEDIRRYIFDQWQTLDTDTLYVFHKLITGSWKALFSPLDLSKVLAAAYKTDIALIGMRINDYLYGAYGFDALIDPVWTEAEDAVRPYAFTKPLLLDQPLDSLGHPAQWIVEPFIHGLKVQIHKRTDKIMIWAEDQYWLHTIDKSLKKTLDALPGHCILEAIIVSSDPPGKKVEKEVNMDNLIGTDIILWDSLPQDTIGDLLTRKSKLTQWAEEQEQSWPATIPHQTFLSWDLVKNVPLSAGHVAKHGLHSLNSPLWYRLKPPPVVILTALMYAELPNQTMEADFELTLGLKDPDDTLVPVVKLSSSSLSDSKKTSLYYWIQNNTVKRFGPVRLLRQGQVFKISFERVEINKKVKAGLKLVHVEILDIYQTADLEKVDSMDVFERN